MTLMDTPLQAKLPARKFQPDAMSSHSRSLKVKLISICSNKGIVSSRQLRMMAKLLELAREIIARVWLQS